MYADDIPAILSFLTSHGYLIDKQLSHLLHHSRIDIGGVSDRRISGERKFLFHGTYSGEPTPLP
jgi:hypothetical protein